MAKIKLTKSTVEAAEITGKDYELRDTSVPGFLCKVTAHGRKVFMLQYRTNWGERRKPKIGQFGELTVEQARSIAQDWLADVRALLIGAGDTIELVARHLHDAGVAGITCANRTLERAAELAARYGANAILLADLPEHLHQADVVISSTASQLPVLGKGAVESALKRRRHRPMLMVDIAVPRDIEPEVGQLDDVYLYTVDDLREVIDEGRRAREDAAVVATGGDPSLG